MDESPGRGLGVLGFAALLGVLGDALLRATPWGINLPLWMMVAGASVWAVLAEPTDDRGRVAGWPWAAVVFFAWCFAWRDSEFLSAWNVIAILTALSLPALQLRGVRLRLARLTDIGLGLVAGAANAALGPLLLSANQVPLDKLSRHGRRTRSVVVGGVLAVPILLVFGGLLASADPGFDRLVNSLVDWDFGLIAQHVALTGFVAWIAAGHLRSVSADRDAVLELGRTAIDKAPRRPTLGIVELGIPLGALGVIFLVFVGLQARYLFGGESVILETAGLTYAEYARGGFFELVTVAALMLPVLLGADWLMDTRHVRGLAAFRILAGTLLGLVGLIMLSAVQRMRLYMDAYGLTEDRFYAMAFMAWIGVVLALFGATVLRRMRHRFAFGALTTGFATLAVLNAANPDAVIARHNLARAEAGAELDWAHAARMPADAVPELVSRAPALIADAECAEFWEAIERWVPGEATDWRTWNLGRARARRAILRAASRGCG